MRPRLSDLLRKTLVALLGAALILAGLAGSVLPIVPGFVLIAAGFVVLAREFHWADRLVERVRTRFADLRDRGSDAPSPAPQQPPARDADAA